MLRYYEQQGLLHPGRTANGYRHYGEDAITIVAQIRGLIGAGLSTETIRQILPCAQGVAPTIESCPEMLATLANELRQLDHRIRHLRTSRTALHRYLSATRDAAETSR